MKTFDLDTILSTKNNVYKFTPGISNNSKLIIVFSGLGFTEHYFALLNAKINVFDNIDENPSTNNTTGLDFYKRLITDPFVDKFDHFIFSDFSKKGYLNGVPGISKNAEETRDFLIQFIDSKKYSKIYFLGTCIGSYQSLLQACLLKKYYDENPSIVTDINVLSFNGYTDMNNDNTHIKNLSRFPSVDTTYDNCINLYKSLDNSTPPTLNTIFYSDESVKYTNEIYAITGSSIPVTHNIVAGGEQKNIAAVLSRAGQMENILTTYLS